MRNQKFIYISVRKVADLEINDELEELNNYRVIEANTDYILLEKIEITNK